MVPERATLNDESMLSLTASVRQTFGNVILFLLGAHCIWILTLVRGRLKHMLSVSYAEVERLVLISLRMKSPGLIKDCTLYSLADLFNQTPSQFLWEAFSYATIKTQSLFIQLSELAHCNRNKLGQGSTSQHKM